METKMTKKPVVAPGQWINIEGVNSVVCQVSKDAPYEIEVVCMDKGKATNKDAKWDTGKWTFTSGAGGYADDYPRLSEFVSKLRCGRQYHLGE